MDRSSPSPLHAQIAAELRDQIRDHRLPPGAALPTEQALTERFGVARSVVRQALATLVAEGLVERGRGRGSVVAPAREHHRLVQRTSGLSAQMAAEGLAVTTAVLSLQVEPAPEIAAWLGTPQVVRLERLRSVDGEPLAYIRTYLPAPACAGLTAEELTDASLHQVLTDRLGLRPSGGRRQVRAVAADADLARELQVDAGAPLLLLEGHGEDQHGQPLEVFATWHRADAMAFDVDVQVEEQRDGGAAPVSPMTAPSEAPTAPSDLRAAAAQARQLADLLGRLASEGGSMTTSLRVSDATRARASALAAASGRSIGELVEQALDAYERAQFWEQTRRALAERGQAQDEDAQAWDRTVRDGLERE